MRAMALRGVGRMSIHVPFWMLPFLDDVAVERGSTMRTRLGNVLINTGLGFSGVGPDSTGNLGGAQLDDLTGQYVTDNTAYIYATRGTPEYAVSELQRYSQQGQLVQHRANSAFASTARHGAIRFDPGCVYAVRVCLNETSNC